MTIIVEFSEDELLIIQKAILHIYIIDYEQILHKILRAIELYDARDTTQ